LAFEGLDDLGQGRLAQVQTPRRRRQAALFLGDDERRHLTNLHVSILTAGVHQTAPRWRFGPDQNL
jgi:hypothetical protein